MWVVFSYVGNIWLSLILRDIFFCLLIIIVGFVIFCKVDYNVVIILERVFVLYIILVLKILIFLFNKICVYYKNDVVDFIFIFLFCNYVIKELFRVVILIG